ncbi:type I restriction-modification system subunit M [Arthrospira platensis]|uniref:site-specific DNA-methyltransferase (adenine-specific) n=2 Tax=Limnospira platensis TaxID=118562 RepID=Q307A1_LIMPL|nr:type I restriction-modification system subunit M [Arthrospira platensis]MBD2670065.1 type I restriction-modification system subunit M [Arthrospira platensis FACHB-439]MBD2710582.1 type I restriction-modification system subunit M [Arthrospira platensis FACHB-835]WAK74298.1 type I restriction-modification system subunit M [Arthrospira sp. PCC 9108]ABB51238.1 type I RM system M subunit [Arthrospira platensis]MBD2573944.1 type I restriction-modification system subunit M [Arthrospira platensis F
MAVKKTQLYSSLWAGCDELRGGMDASQYKDYVLTLLFLKYVSDKYAGKPNPLIIVPQGAAFSDLVKLKGDKEIGDKINKVIDNLAAENDLKGVIDIADFNDEDKLGKGKEMVDRLSRLVGIFEGINLSANRADGDDLLGDAYEYLMRNFATESGKSKGQFYTPAEVSRVVAKVLAIPPETRQDATVYDPTCGSGSLLLKVADEAPNGLSIYGQEMDNATYSLARMNMFMHNHPTAEIWKDNTLAAPYWKEKDGSLKRFDFAVANPPFSYKSWSNGVDTARDEFNRFGYGVPPAKNGDYAFLLHILKSLKSTGKAAVILPHGVLFRGNAEATIRQNLVTQGYIKGIIGLPPNLFYGTGIPACIIVLDKAEAATRDGLFMIDASKGFIKDGNKNRLRSQDIHKIVDVFNNQLEIPRYSRLVSLEEIAANDYNLNIPRYIDSSEPEDLHDLNAHINGGIPQGDINALGHYWQVFPTLKADLFTETRPGYFQLSITNYQHSIKNHPEAVEFVSGTLALYHQWRDHHRARLENIAIGDKPKELIGELSEDLLGRLAAADLLDNYDIYQLLMDYWGETMQDDVYLLAQDGWEGGKVLRELVVSKGQKLTETPDLVMGKKKYKADLIPPSLLVARYFAEKQAQIDDLQADCDGVTQELEGLIEENTGEDGALTDAQTDAGKVTKGNLTKLIKGLKGLPLFDGSEEERQQLAICEECLGLFDREAELKKAIKAAQEALDRLVFAKYPKLREEEIKTLVIVDKWGATLEGMILAEIERVTQQLASRIKELDERYAEPLPQLVDEVERLASRVDEHLKQLIIDN